MNTIQLLPSARCKARVSGLFIRSRLASRISSLVTRLFIDPASRRRLTQNPGQLHAGPDSGLRYSICWGLVSLRSVTAGRISRSIAALPAIARSAHRLPFGALFGGEYPIH